MCRSQRNVQSVIATNSDEESFLGVVHSEMATVNETVDPWMTKIMLNGQEIEFKIDTGADVTVIPESNHDATRDGPLAPPGRSLSGPSQQTLDVLGQFSGRLNRNDTEVKQDIFVIHGLQKALLGRPAIECLKIVSQVEQVQTTDTIDRFPQLFSGLGRLKERYKIKLRSDAKPFALSTPRRIAVPLLPKVKAELQRMENLGVISKIDTPTEWCAGMVVVPKPNGAVRICVDLTKLNDSVCREHHILPSVEHVLDQIGGARYFSKLFWQVKLSPESSKLTFITPFGRFCFNRLPFGITSAPEHFQRRMNEILGDLEGVVGLIDDVLIHGKAKEEHDARLTAVLTRLCKSGLTLGQEKCEFCKTHIKFLGQLLDQSGVRPDP